MIESKLFWAIVVSIIFILAFLRGKDQDEAFTAIFILFVGGSLLALVTSTVIFILIYGFKGIGNLFS